MMSEFVLTDASNRFYLIPDPRRIRNEQANFDLWNTSVSLGLSIERVVLIVHQCERGC